MNEQILAQLFLEHRKHGYSIRLVLRRMKRRYILSVTLCVVMSFIACSLSLYWFAYIILGIYMGGFLRDIGWLRAIKKTWPFTEKITDWNKVEAIANGDE